MPRKLVVTSIPNDFDPATHVALGPWCFFQREEVYPDWDRLDFLDPFEDPEVRGVKADEAIQTANALLDELWPEMNRRHGCNHDRAFWHTLLMNWLMHLVMLSWRLWAQTALFIETHGDETFEVALDSHDGPFRFGSTVDFIMAVFGDSPFRRWLTHEVVRRQQPAHWSATTGEVIVPPPVSKEALKPVVWGPIGNIGGLNRLHLKLLDLYVRLLPRRAAKPRKSPEVKGFPEALPAGLLALLRQLLDETMPLALAENLPALEAHLKGLPVKPGRLHISIPSYHSDQDNLQTALAAEAGERIAMMQHGGTYGWARTISMTGELEFCHDRFLSWGWKHYDNYRGRFIPLPPPLIGRLLGRHRPQDDRMILVGAAIYGLNPRIDNYPNPVPYRQRKLRFIEALPQSLREKLGYRPYRDPKCFADADYLRRVFPDLQLVEGDLTQAMLRARLVVQDHHSTTLCLTLGANIPTIGIWDERAWPLGGDGKPAFDKLRQAGIIFDDPAEAARHIERIWPDVQGWWQSKTVQDARKEWAAQFGWGSRWWWLYWLWRLPQL